MYNLAFSIAPADVIAPSGFRTSACVVMTTFQSYIYIQDQHLKAGLDLLILYLLNFS